MNPKQKIRSTLTLLELIIRGLGTDKDLFVLCASFKANGVCVCVRH